MVRTVTKGPTTGSTKGPTTATEVKELLVRARDVCARLDPACIGLAEVPGAFDDLVALDRLAGGAVTRMAARYDEAGAWKRNGTRSAEDDIGRKTGTGTSRARRKLSTSKRLRDQPKTDDAVRRGEVSDDQADEVSDGASASPEAEDELLSSARNEPMQQLRKRAAAARARADRDREATRRRLHRNRCVRRWDDGEGMGNLLLRLPGDEMAEIDAALKRGIDRRLVDARHAGRFEPPEAYAADEVRDRLLGTTGDDTGHGDGSNPVRRNQAVRPDKKVIAIVDAEALNRGHVEGDETCVIAGVGPVSVSAVRRLMSDAFLALAIKDGVDVRSVVHLGRQVTAHQRTALEARGGACEFCGSRFRVEIDHIDGWSLTHDTKIDDLSFKCWTCHDAKTRHHLRETGPPGNRKLLHPDGTPWRAPPSPPQGTDGSDGGAGDVGDVAGGRDALDDAARAGPARGGEQGDLFTLAL